MKYFFFLILFWAEAQAFTLNNNFGGVYGKSKVKVYVAGNTICNNLNLTVYDLESMLGPAVNNFWNQVSTSKLRLSSAGFTTTINNVNSGILCSPTDDDCITNAGGNIIPPVNHIVVACNDNCKNFSANASCSPGDGSNVLAVTIPNKFSGKTIKGSVILINNQIGSAFAGRSRSDQIAIISHEIGHAIGLGHSEDKAALMFYRTIDLRKNLGQDDIDGVTYLYPMKFDGCGLFGGTITTDKIDPQMWQMGISFAMFLMILNLVKKLFNRSQRRPAF